MFRPAVHATKHSLDTYTHIEHTENKQRTGRPTQVHTHTTLNFGWWGPPPPMGKTRVKKQLGKTSGKTNTKNPAPSYHQLQHRQGNQHT